MNRAIVLAAALGACIAACAIATAPAQEPAARDIEYIPGGGESNKLDIYLPEAAQQPMPVVIYIHGGAWVEGSKGGGGYARELLKHGYAVVSINYRLSTQAPFPAQLEDCKAAVRWLRANAKSYGIDPERVGVTGESAGGHLCSLLALTGSNRAFDKGANLDQRSDVQAALTLFGPADLSQATLKSDIAKMNIGKDKAQWMLDCVSKLLGADPARNPEKARNASPLSHVSARAAPMMIIHGKSDDTVCYRQSERLNESLNKAGAECKLILVDGMGHSSGQAFANGRAEQALAFLNAHLKGDPSRKTSDSPASMKLPSRH